MLTNEDEQVDFWEVVQLYTERLFLIPSLPSGVLAMVSGRVHQREGEYSLCCYPLWLLVVQQELQLPGFSSNLTVWPPRGGEEGGTS